MSGNRKYLIVSLVIAVIALMVLWRIPSWNHGYSLCIDEAEWLALASRMDGCSLPFSCFNASTSGFVSIWILKVLSWFGQGYEYLPLRIFGFLAFIIPTYLIILTGVRKLYGTEVRNHVFIWLSSFFIFGFYNREFLTYNTEYPLILLYSLSMLFYFDWKKNSRIINLIVLGLLLGLMPYVKLQSVPFVFAVYILILVAVLRKKQYKELLIFSLFTGFFSVLFFVYFWYNNVLTDFYRMYIESNAFYVNNRVTKYKYSDNEFIHRLRAFKGMHIETFLPLYFGLLAFVVLNFKSVREKIRLNSLDVNWDLVIMFLFICYSTYTTGNGFGHYNILLLPSVFYLIGNFYHILLPEINLRRSIYISLLSCSIPCLIYLKRSEALQYGEKYGENACENYIRTNTKKGDYVLYLGYVQALESQVHTGRKLAVRNATNQYITIADKDLNKYYKAGFVSDINSSQPLYIADVENVLKDTLLADLKYFIHSKYMIDTIIDEKIVYRLKDGAVSQ